MFFDLCGKEIHLGKRGLVNFLQGPTFQDFIDSRLLNYIPSGIRITFRYILGNFFLGQVLAPSSSESGCRMGTLHCTKMAGSSFSSNKKSPKSREPHEKLRDLRKIHIAKVAYFGCLLQIAQCSYSIHYCPAKT